MRGREDGTIQNEWVKNSLVGGRCRGSIKERHYRDRGSPADLNS